MRDAGSVAFCKLSAAVLLMLLLLMPLLLLVLESFLPTEQHDAL